MTIIILIENHLVLQDTYDAFHYTSLLYLNNYQQDFKGGRFIFLEPDNSTVVVEPRKGKVKQNVIIPKTVRLC